MEYPVPSHLLLPIIGASTAFLLILVLLFRKRIPARVNCWFCNTNTWIPYHQKNSWVCKACEQYNGFKSDGSYNVVLDTRTTNSTNYALKQSISSMHNGLCHKCNKNQELKVAQLASFVPMNERNFDSEIDKFKQHLEQVYQLCSSCKKFLKYRLSSEKGLHLNSKLSNIRQPKDVESPKYTFDTLNNILTKLLKFVTVTLLLLILYDISNNMEKFLSKTVIYSTKKHFRDIFNGITNISLPIDPFYGYVVDFEFNSTLKKIVALASSYNTTEYVKYVYDAYLYLPQVIVAFSTAGLILQVVRHLFNLNSSYMYILSDVIWSVIAYNAYTGIKYLHILQACFIIILLMIYPDRDESKNKKEDKCSKGKIKNLLDDSVKNDAYDEDSDSDVSSYCDSSYSVRPNRRFYQKFVSNPFLEKNNVSKIQKPARYAFSDGVRSMKDYELHKLKNHRGNKKWDADLNRSINDLNLGCNIDKINKSSVFAPKRFDGGDSNLFSVSSQLRHRPILSPSRLSNGTYQSWVAGGYWGADTSRSLQSIHETSSSSSQSSGFESLASSIYRNNVTSFPPSRENSISSECDINKDFSINSLRNFSTPATFASFSLGKSPIFPVIRPNECVNIPQLNNSFNDVNSVKSAHSLSNFNPNYTFLPLEKPAFNRTLPFS